MCIRDRYGIIGVLVLRAIMIALGAVIVEQFEWVLYLFAAFLVITGVKMLFHGGEEQKLEDNKIVKWSQKIIKVSPNSVSYTHLDVYKRQYQSSWYR